MTEIIVWRNRLPDLIKYHGSPWVIWVPIDPGHQVIDHSAIYVMEGNRPAELVGIEICTIAKDSPDWACSARLEPVVGDLDSVKVASSDGITELPMFLLKDC